MSANTFVPGSISWGLLYQSSREKEKKENATRKIWERRVFGTAKKKKAKKGFNVILFIKNATKERRDDETGESVS